MVFPDDQHHPNRDKRQETRDFPDRLDHSDVMAIKVGPLNREVIEQRPPSMEAHHGGHAEYQQKTQHWALPIRNEGD
jgi:hypothetical protein